MLTSRVIVPPPSTLESEDIFSSALGALFTDDTQNSHGTPGSSIIYQSPRFNDISLHIPAHPDVEDGRKLFAHYLWNAAVIVADAIETASSDDQSESGRESWDKTYWDMRGQRVLELGSGTALPSLISALCGASNVTITDHPSSPALTTDAISHNVKENLFQKRNDGDVNLKQRTDATIHVYGYTWGTTRMYSTEKYGQLVPGPQGPFDRIIIADCLWMPSQHVNLVKTVLHYLDPNSPHSCALVVAGFHTGRGIVRQFIEIATGERSEDSDASFDQDEEVLQVRGRLKAAEMFEIDVNGVRRPWKSIRQDEDKVQAKKWCVCLVLVRI